MMRSFVLILATLSTAAAMETRAFHLIDPYDPRYHQEFVAKPQDTKTTGRRRRGGEEQKLQDVGRSTNKDLKNIDLLKPNDKQDAKQGKGEKKKVKSSWFFGVNSKQIRSMVE